MRQLIVTELIAVAGVSQASGGEPTHPHVGWTTAYGSPQLYAFTLQESLDAESLLLTDPCA